MDRRPIGIFDSGVGGLTVLAAIRAQLPGEDLIYLGDTARVPYGSRGPDTIRRYSENVVRHLVMSGCKAVVVACNTASAWAIDHLRRSFDLPIIDVIDPVARQVAQADQSEIVVLATRGTVQSGAYRRALTPLVPTARILQQACPLFVPLAEEGLEHTDIAAAVARHYLAPVAADAHTPLAVILGCTHYPLLRTTIAKALSDLGVDQADLFDSGGPTALALAATLERERIATDASIGSLQIRVTDDPAALGTVATRFLGVEPGPIQHVDIGVATS